ncbi:MAG: hypothetical protein GTO63_30030 [Anaerolineae bacterium]|nr:hypothetical protein [Anaerolineae bacterium]NIN98945.1 hypothetical protein [Anaerolineae bacterium]
MGFGPQAGGPGAKAQKFLTARGMELFRPLARPGGATPESLVDLFQQFTIPQFGGPFAAPPTPLQMQGAGGFGRFLAGFQPEQLTSPLFGIAGGGQMPDIESLLQVGREAEERLIGEEQSRIRERQRIGGVRESVGTQRAEAELAARIGERGLAERQRLAAQLQDQAQLRQLQAALGLPGAVTGALQPFRAGFDIGDIMRQAQDVGLQRQMFEFARTQGALFPQALSFLTEAPVAFGPGLGSQLLSAGAQLGGGALSGGMGGAK